MFRHCTCVRIIFVLLTVVIVTVLLSPKIRPTCQPSTTTVSSATVQPPNPMLAPRKFPTNPTKEKVSSTTLHPRNPLVHSTAVQPRNPPVRSTAVHPPKPTKEKVRVNPVTNIQGTGTLLNPKYTLTRLGSQLHFDVRSCPPGSTMTDTKTQNTSPLFSDCPTLFVVGARKGGTTSMIQYVSKHEDFEAAQLNGPKVGEIFFFSNKLWEPNQEQWKWYKSNFPQNVMSGESSVTYLVHCQVPQRIFRSCGRQVKIVILLRNPVDRFVSNFLMRVKVKDKFYGPKYENTTIESIVEDELKFYHSKISNISFPNVQQGWQNMLCRFLPTESMIFEGMYYIHLLNWMCSFPAENIMIINSEEFFSNTSIVLSQVIQFLGLHPLEQEKLKEIASVTYNPGRHHAPRHQQLSKRDRQKLNKVFEPFDMALFQLLNWNIDWTQGGY